MASISATGIHRELSQTAIADSTPIREGSRVQHGAFERSLLLEARSDAKNLADISGDGVEIAALRSAAKPSHLRGRSIQKQRAHGIRIQAIDLAAISGAQQRQASGIKSDGINDILSVRPDLARRANRINPIYFRAAGEGLSRAARNRGGSRIAHCDHSGNTGRGS